MSGYGISCWNTQHRHGGCDHHFESEPGETEAATHHRAGLEGWVIGHNDGQGHYACPQCADTLWDPISLADDDGFATPTHSDKA